MSSEVAGRIQSRFDDMNVTDVGGIGGTLSGNALSLAAMRATLSEVLTDEAFSRMLELGGRWADGVKLVIDEADLPWEVQQLGARAEYWFRETPPMTGAEAAAADDHELARFLHLHALNRGVLITPFHNMALMCPATTDADVDAHTEVFREAATALLGD
jgi:glutamate-1-semialdehyde aminotransferase